jgi:hypothetical protein
MADTPKPETPDAAGVDPQILVAQRLDALAKLLEAHGEHQAAAYAGGLSTVVSSAAAPSLLSRLTPRLLPCLLLVVGLAAALSVVSPQQLPVALYKLSLVTLAGYLGYWLDRWAFPYARPDSFLAAADWRSERGAVQGQANHAVVPGCEQIYAAAQIRRALVILGAMLAMGLGL